MQYNSQHTSQGWKAFERKPQVSLHCERIETLVTDRHLWPALEVLAGEAGSSKVWRSIRNGVPQGQADGEMLGTVCVLCLPQAQTLQVVLSNTTELNTSNQRVIVGLNFSRGCTRCYSGRTKHDSQAPPFFGCHDCQPAQPPTSAY